jgi:hypothetical protein
VVTRKNAVSAPQPKHSFVPARRVYAVGKRPRHRDRRDRARRWIAGRGRQRQFGRGRGRRGHLLRGLGDVTPPAVAGSPTPPSPLSHVIDLVTLTIGGVDVPVSFAGLSPGFTGLYQVNATVPTGIAPNQQAPLELSQRGPTSATVTIPNRMSRSLEGVCSHYYI